MDACFRRPPFPRARDRARWPRAAVGRSCAATPLAASGWTMRTPLSATRNGSLPVYIRPCILLYIHNRARLEFEWDPEKAEQNFIHHGIDFDDAIAIFDGATLDFEDDRERYDEQRFVSIGIAHDRILTVVYTMRGNVCRLISAWKATPRERRAYRKAQGE
jgi:uncharacterized protein